MEQVPVIQVHVCSVGTRRRKRAPRLAVMLHLARAIACPEDMTAAVPGLCTLNKRRTIHCMETPPYFPACRSTDSEYDVGCMTGEAAVCRHSPSMCKGQRQMRSMNAIVGGASVCQCMASGGFSGNSFGNSKCRCHDVPESLVMVAHHENRSSPHGCAAIDLWPQPSSSIRSRARRSVARWRTSLTPGFRLKGIT